MYKCASIEAKRVVRIAEVEVDEWWWTKLGGRFRGSRRLILKEVKRVRKCPTYLFEEEMLKVKVTHH